ncbi:hypothetical protein CMU94_02225 [Elizabethkingia anophelis]|nr:hypothetical protein [Elizabethkingia anophelis]
MKTIQLEFPKGLKNEITNVLNAISQICTPSSNNNKVIIEFIGVCDKWEEHLRKIRSNEYIEILSIK